MLWKTATTGTLALCTVGMCWAADEPTMSLTIGDPAPAIDVAHWLKGEQVGEFQSEKVYVLEFWATWCGPCRASIPHLSELQERYQDYDVSFIGVSDETLQKVVPFLCKADKEGKLWNDKMQYTVATDPDRSTFLEYMLASGNSGIPTAFIIGRDGRIEWIGHPMEIDEPLEAVVKDAWDRAEFKAQWEPKMAPERAKLRPYMTFERARRGEDWPAALESLDELIATDPSVSNHKINKMLVYIRDLNQPQKGYTWGRQIMREHWDDASGGSPHADPIQCLAGGIPCTPRSASEPSGSSSPSPTWVSRACVCVRAW